jgi:Flp pilus assembly pilin Flp
MNRIGAFLRDLLVGEGGVALVEYGLVLGLVVLAAMGALVALGQQQASALALLGSCLGGAGAC